MAQKVCYLIHMNSVRACFSITTEENMGPLRHDDNAGIWPCFSHWAQPFLIVSQLIQLKLLSFASALIHR